MKTSPYPTTVALTTLLMFSTGVQANTPIGAAGPVITDTTHSSPLINYSQEKPLSRWAVAFDNDLLVPSTRDQDYTYGLSLTMSGSSSRSNPLSMHRPLNWLNQHFGVPKRNNAFSSHSIEVGLYGFTPENIDIKSANHDDRPYAGLVYLSSSNSVLGATDNTAWHSSLTIGILGLNVIGDLQNEIHSITNSDEAKGWNHQISDGGEITARYSLAHQRLWNISNPSLEIKSTVQASAGYLSEVSWSVNMRLGQIDSHWKNFNPELANYREQATQIADSMSRNESYLLAGIAIKARAYNAFLQGQFRHSDVSYSSNELNHGILEAWIGYTHTFSSGYQLTYLLRGHSSEVKAGTGDRNVMWGGLTLAKLY